MPEYTYAQLKAFHLSEFEQTIMFGAIIAKMEKKFPGKKVQTHVVLGDPKETGQDKSMGNDGDYRDGVKWS